MMAKDITPQNVTIDSGSKSEDLGRDDLSREDLALDYPTKLKINIQRFFGWVFLLPISLTIIGLFKFKLKYKVENLNEVRKKYLKIVNSKNKVVICSNHLTLIDSIILLWALSSPFRNFLNYRLFSWNFPAKENAKSKISWHIITFLSKCIFVERLGSQKHTGSLVDQMAYLLSSRDICMIFPEGTRSRSGKVDVSLVNYGIGKIIQKIPDCEILCVYLRGDKQKTYSDFPDKNSTFTISMETLKPTTTLSGLRGSRDLATQVIKKIKELEDAYFANNAVSN
jgi:hypothetical protein